MGGFCPPGHFIEGGGILSGVFFSWGILSGGEGIMSREDFVLHPLNPAHYFAFVCVSVCLCVCKYIFPSSI